MIIEPMIRNNICMNAHPQGCELHVRQQIDYVRRKGVIPGPKKVLVIGGSAGYGLATRIVAAFGAGAGTICVAFEREPTEKRDGSAGWYAATAFDQQAQTAGLSAETIFADAFSHQTRQRTIERVRELLGSLDLVVYSLASGLRIDPDTGEQYRSVLKPLGRTYSNKTVDPMTGTLSEAEITPASDEEAAATVKVMGGEDWALWINALEAAGVLANGAMTVAYSYIGPELTRPVYREGTIGRAKDHLEQTARELDGLMQQRGGRAFVSVNKALVTRASAVIPVVPLYLGILYRVMKRKGLHEGCIEQIYRLFAERLYAGRVPELDEQGRIRLDDWEMREDVQAEINQIWPTVTSQNLDEVADLEGYRQEFLQLHGFGYPQIDYSRDV
ncbi:MAG: trans-2-enoyl-CoA reductase family protein [Spirochaetaceae bacterium]|nr:MAG: trans-2-enoyl-CoA reductase family protein [Spirochaetaceae bacterium]